LWSKAADSTTGSASTLLLAVRLNGAASEPHLARAKRFAKSLTKPVRFSSLAEMREVAMHKPFYTFIVTLVIGITSSIASIAADDGWKMPNLNPFASKGKPSTAARAGSPPTSGWHMPKLWPSPAPDKRRVNQPTAWNKMTSGTQKFFSKTADALNPWDDTQPKPEPKISGSNTAFTHNNAAKQESKSSSVRPTSWWKTDTKDQTPKSVNEFLSQPRPH
jgi:hypothetical protein